jgi:4-hydroxybenzoyl-CoA reductase subunit beta
MAKQLNEVVTSVTLAADRKTSTAYVKLRRRGSIDFPIAGAAVAIQLDGDEVVTCHIVLSAVASHPLVATAAEEFLKGKRVTDETIRETADIAAKPAKPLDNADLAHFWRKRMVRVVVEDALVQATTRTAGSTVKLLGRNPD